MQIGMELKLLKTKSYSMSERQLARENGKYIKMFVCEDCGKALGHNYYSDPKCDEKGSGLVLCKKCCSKREKE